MSVRVHVVRYPDCKNLTLRWTDPDTGHTLFGAVDDALEFPDGSLAIIDYKSSGSAACMSSAPNDTSLAASTTSFEVVPVAREIPAHHVSTWPWKTIL